MPDVLYKNFLAFTRREITAEQVGAAWNEHLSLANLRPNVEDAIKKAKALGQQYVVLQIIWPDQMQSRAVLDEFCRAPRHGGRPLRIRGPDVQLPQPLGRDEDDQRLRAVPGHPRVHQSGRRSRWSSTCTEPCTNADPVELFRKNPGRYVQCHVKDSTASGDFATVGKGIIDFPKILPAAPARRTPLLRGVRPRRRSDGGRPRRPTAISQGSSDGLRPIASAQAEIHGQGQVDRQHDDGQECDGSQGFLLARGEELDHVGFRRARRLARAGPDRALDTRQTRRCARCGQQVVGPVSAVRSIVYDERTLGRVVLIAPSVTEPTLPTASIPTAATRFSVTALRRAETAPRQSQARWPEESLAEAVQRRGAQDQQPAGR